MHIPEQGMQPESLLAELEGFKKQDVPWRSGRVFAYVYDAGKQAEDIAKRAYTMFLTENGLDPTSFPSLLKLENDVISMARAHLNGDENVVGHFTSGGTESIILAMKAARDFMHATRGITDPEVALPITAHAAFHKAAHYLGVKVVPVAVHSETFKADVKSAEKAIGKNTVMVVGSAPSYAHGVMDPIRELAALASSRNVPMHVDGCIGAFLCQWLRKLGEKIEPFDFTVPGVTSISMDLHKYAFTPKGASVVLYRNADLRRHQIFACSRWTGYTMVNPTIQSSKSGGPLAAAWAVMRFFGEAGYLKIADELRQASKKVVDGVKQVPGMRLLGDPVMCLLAFAADGLSVFHISDEMKQRGWFVHPQLAFENSPVSLHLTINPNNIPNLGNFLTDLKAAADAARKLESGQGEQMAKFITEQLGSNPGPEAFAQVMAATGTSSDQLPDRMAVINEILNGLPRELSEKLIVEFSAQMFTPTK